MSCSSCTMAVGPLCQSIYQSASFSQKTKKFLCGDNIKTGFGAKHYKFRCEKVGKCCEVGKDCEEDNEDKETKK